MTGREARAGSYRALPLPISASPSNVSSAKAAPLAKVAAAPQTCHSKPAMALDVFFDIFSHRFAFVLLYVLFNINLYWYLNAHQKLFSHIKINTKISISIYNMYS